jgi:protein-disulfide isomerase-like protein with CxxC motif
MTSELGLEKWAVVSDRGCEATNLTHEDARRLVHKLGGEGRHGLCIMSNDAASRISEDAKQKSSRNSSAVTR